MRSSFALMTITIVALLSFLDFSSAFTAFTSPSPSIFPLRRSPLAPTSPLSPISPLSAPRTTSPGSFNPPPLPGSSTSLGCGVGFVVNPVLPPSHKILSDSLAALGCMEHRGACGGDGMSGDGAGVMTSIPWELFEDYASPDCPKPAVGMTFLPRHNPELAEEIKEKIRMICIDYGLGFIGWREVPVDESVLGPNAREAVPRVEQFFVKAPEKLTGDSERDAFERTLYLIRRRVMAELADHKNDMYIASFSSQTIVYKGMVKSEVLPLFYKDLVNEDYKTNFCIYHRRYSTNTNPRWPLAQPMRVLGHNGEINTLLGNVNWMIARESAKGDNELTISDMVDPQGSDDVVMERNTQNLEGLEPLVDLGNSDSANLDSVFELMTKSRHRAPCALMGLVPAAYKNEPTYDANADIAAFQDYHSGLLEAWDGPALLVFCDGNSIGASLDRNGLRPARFSRTKDGTVYIMSETGVIPGLEESTIVSKGRLGPGQMINVNLETGEFKDNIAIKSEISKRHDYQGWMKKNAVHVKSSNFVSQTERSYDDPTTNFLQASFGWSLEDIGMQINDMASSGKETTYSMGDDAPLSILSTRPHHLSNYFKQRFAQVTNPPIDPLREGIVMSLGMTLGKKQSINKVTEKGARLIHLDSPFLNQNKMDYILSLDAKENGGFKNQVISTRYNLDEGPDGLNKAIDDLCASAVKAVKSGVEVLVISDRPSPSHPFQTTTYIPPNLAVGAVHHSLIASKVRMDAGIIVETGAAWTTHHFATLVGYGAHAVFPYMALETTQQWWNLPVTQSRMESGKMNPLTIQKAQDNLQTSIENGLLKILSKIGISLLSSYHGAQIFEAIGLGPDVIDKGFKGTTSRIGGLSISELAIETVNMRPESHDEDEAKKLTNYGYYKPIKSAEYHANSADLARLLHDAVGLDKTVVGKKREKAMAANDAGKQPSVANYEIFKTSLETAPLAAIRDLLDLKSDRQPIDISEVEPVEKIMERFCTGAMSLGALSREAHETLAIAVNRIGGKSNSGEGGEDVLRSKVIDDVNSSGKSENFPHLFGLKKGDSANSYVHQIASGRFGVTPEFLVTAKQLEIKMAQGAKPGEGGQLPGPKVSEYIAGLRASKQGVTLISPPPHHDIYSIEDLAQLIHDLHAINEDAGVSVKLVSSIGIGTVACGCAKAAADVIQISGGDGGTGASPLSSIKHAGCPFELGITEAHSALVNNNLRSKVVLRVDGGIRTGRDVLMAALMGAEEYGFGTIAMIAEGCVMARVCHMNTCPVGVTSQKEDLRKKFPGTPDNVVQFFEFVGEEVRSLLAHMGYTSLNDLIGRGDLLAQDEKITERVTKSANVNIKDFFQTMPDVKENRSWLLNDSLKPKDSEVHINGPSSDLDREVTADVAAAVDSGVDSFSRTYKIYNTDRSTGAMVAGSIAKKWGNKGFLGTLNLGFEGSAGQAFGAFNLPGMKIQLKGEANDYVGKGMNGGEILIEPAPDAGFEARSSSIVGNACLYGATGGDFHANGRAGERFAVRNSGAYAVNEGSGDHLCEYMTGGVVVCLGSTGRNIGAGMTGGLAYILSDEKNRSDFKKKYVNNEIVKVQRIKTSAAEAQLRSIVERHALKCNSRLAKEILLDWENKVMNEFFQIYPPSEKDGPLVLAPEGEEFEPGAQISISAGGPNNENQKQCFLVAGEDFGEYMTGQCAD